MSRIAALSALAFLSSSLPSLVTAQSPAVEDSEQRQWPAIQLSDRPSSSANTAAELSPQDAVKRLRQQRAAYQYHQRIARIEANAWYGHEPLRPSWSSVPMMSSNYSPRRTIVIPVYVP